MLDARAIAAATHGAGLPVTTAIYFVAFVMNEDDPEASDEASREEFAAEIQRVMDDANFTTALRYDSVDFDVIARIPIRTEEPSE